MQILGIEPRSSAWKANNLTINIYLQKCFNNNYKKDEVGFEPTVPRYISFQD